MVLFRRLCACVDRGRGVVSSAPFSCAPVSVESQVGLVVFLILGIY